MTRPAPLQALYVSGMSVTSTAVEAVPRPGRRLQWFFGTGAPDTRRRLGLPGPQTREAAAQLWRYERHKWLWFLPWSELPEHVLGPLTPYFKALPQPAPARTPSASPGATGRSASPSSTAPAGTTASSAPSTTSPPCARRGAPSAPRRQPAPAGRPLGAHRRPHPPRRRPGLRPGGRARPPGPPAALVRPLAEGPRHRDAGRPAGALLPDGPQRVAGGGRLAPGRHPGGPLVPRQRRAGQHRRRRRPARPPAPRAGRPGGRPGRCDVYRYDPRDPVPTVWPLEDQYLPLDQRPLDGREDLLVYVSAPLERELAFAGDPGRGAVRRVERPGHGLRRPALRRPPGRAGAAPHLRHRAGPLPGRPRPAALADPGRRRALPDPPPPGRGHPPARTPPAPGRDQQRLPQLRPQPQHRRGRLLRPHPGRRPADGLPLRRAALRPRPPRAPRRSRPDHRPGARYHTRARPATAARR